MPIIFFDTEPSYNCTRIQSNEDWSTIPPTATDAREVTRAEIPADRTFRNALKPDLSYDLDKAREITKARLRVERAPLLAALDTDFMRAIEEGKPTSGIVAQKQALRDVTDQADAAADLEELKALKA